MPITKTLASAIAESITKKIPKEVAKGIESSASKTLKGLVYKEGIIQKIVKGKGDWRYIVLENGNTELVDKSIINSLDRSSGTAKQVEKFATEDKSGKLAQAYKSLEMHLGKAEVDKKLIVDYHNNYRNQLKLSGQKVPAMSLVKAEGKHLTLPTEYAKVLEKEGAVKIIKKLGE